MPPFAITSTSPANSLFSITPNDSTDLPALARQIYVGTGGNVAVKDSEGNTVTHKNVPSGCYLAPFFVVRVLATGTTATDLIGYA